MLSIKSNEIRGEFDNQILQGIYETDLVLGAPLDVRAVEHGRDVGKIPMELQPELTSDERKLVYSLAGDQSVCAVEGRLTKARILTEQEGEYVLTKIVYDVVLENDDVINPYFIEGHILIPEVYKNKKFPGAFVKLLYEDQHKTGINTAEDMLYELSDNVSEARRTI
ncbi:MAG: hypothetical protein KAJ24_03450 [Candidatus Aenigmarchaeota archaeon]|nr:hypothetical protein [Candidatus Aenigmarchaeota archaeon]